MSVISISMTTDSTTEPTPGRQGHERQVTYHYFGLRPTSTCFFTMPKESRSKTKIAKPIPPPPTRPQQCHFYVARKSRYCSLPAKRTNKYCGEHLAEQQKSGEIDTMRRIPCPYDPSHTIFERNLEHHLNTRCNARPKDNEQFYSLNVNCTLSLSEEELEFQRSIQLHKNMYSQPWIARIQLSQLPVNELNALAHKIESIYKEHVPVIRQEILTHDAISSLRTAERFIKHLDQQSSLLGHMEKKGMLQNKKACFIEFGAGRGDLSGVLKKALAEENSESTYVLVDRKNVRNKLDPLLCGPNEKNPSLVQRVLIDIKDLNLSKVQSLMNNQQQMKKVVVLSKHLCGSATDITLKCLMNYMTNQQEKGHIHPISGIIIALCCHQLCRYEMYPNQEYLEKANITKVDFDRICKMSSWATSGSRCSCNSSSTEAPSDAGPKETAEKEEEEEEEEEEEHADIEQEEGDADLSSNHYSGWNLHEREKIGYECKRILDAGRLKYLESCGLSAELVYYVDPSTSLENCALIAVPKQ
ncbi:methyltransferase TRM13-domain-containing protein [Spinellus fusiger]|nr:methyltransferase TRM13-domain-containing protein [Spinellus fusiger]